MSSLKTTCKIQNFQMCHNIASKIFTVATLDLSVYQVVFYIVPKLLKLGTMFPFPWSNKICQVRLLYYFDDVSKFYSNRNSIS